MLPSCGSFVACQMLKREQRGVRVVLIETPHAAHGRSAVGPLLLLLLLLVVTETPLGVIEDQPAATWPCC